MSGTESEQIAHLQQQIEELQTRILFQEDTLQELNDVIAAQDERQTQQQRQLLALADKLKSLEGKIDIPGAPIDERPPHY
ncbi:SlyX family protein [Pseudomaricurvus alkylphenolicus]|jgi:SlyX protein|uniref:SlyX family protein n=1 Tax=Pseudomaricurvus alkylphenolicus TaxID=1306991 RepID=UPI0014242791|nr:SlyX family protein [Pseudomaricurvus alkylphenolicus]NIB42020.1 SlyX family protein [Pseudomaricurvus alkylphenolicus]